MSIVVISVSRPTLPEGINPEFLQFLQQNFNADFQVVQVIPDGPNNRESIEQDLAQRVFNQVELRSAANEALKNHRIVEIKILGCQDQMYTHTIANILACSQAVINEEPIQGKAVFRRPQGYLLVDTIDPDNSLHAFFRL